MPFQSLRAGSPLYILRKADTPCLDEARVVEVKPPYADFGRQGFAPYSQPPVVVDITVETDGGERSIYAKLPALSDIADSGAGVVVSCSKEAMTAEVGNIRRTSEGALATMDRHKAAIAACESILRALHPEEAERAAKEAENAALRQEVERLARIVEGLAARGGWDGSKKGRDNAKNSDDNG